MACASSSASDPASPPTAEPPEFRAPAPATEKTAHVTDRAFATPVPPNDDESISVRGSFGSLTMADLSMIRPINRGAHSVVHLALHRATQRYYALKVFSKERLHCAGPAASREVLREKRALLAVQPHPFLATLHATFQDATRLFLLLELGLGGDLRGVLLRGQRRRFGNGPEQNRRAALAEAEVRFYGASLVLALSHLHAHGFVYRDLKPENVLLDREGYPLLCDFGSAAHLGTAGRTLTLVGTWEYAPIELLSGKGCTLAADWWSLGVLLLEALAGTTPFPSGDADEPHVTLAAARGFGPGSPLLHGLSREACDALTQVLLLPDERRRWGACCGGDGGRSGDGVRGCAFFAPVDLEALLARQLPPPHEPSVLGAADTRNFFHANLDEPDADAVGVGLVALSPSKRYRRPSGEESESPPPPPCMKRARDDGAAKVLDLWADF